MASVARLKMGKPGTGRVVGDKLVGRAIRIYIPLLLLLVVTLFPFYWMAVTSFKSASELFDFSVSPLWVREPTLDWYKHLFTQTNFPHWAFNTAVFCTWMLMGFFKSIPRELEEAALVDGATRIQAMFRIAIPLALPGILAAALFAFTLSWNEFLYSLIFLNDSLVKTIPVGVTQELIHGDEFFWGELMAAALLGSVPVAVLYSFFVDHFVAGMTAGAVKG